jgi:arylsulfatase A-like enzyme
MDTIRIKRADAVLMLSLGVMGAQAATNRPPTVESGTNQERSLKKPNIIIILADDQGYADVGAQGCKDIPTPNIDSIAENGMRFTNGYVSGPYCSPTRAALMTGRYQQRYGCEYLTEWHGTPGLDLKETTIAQRLKQAGYVTGIVGKWHLGTTEGYHPLNRGFDEFFGFLGGGHVYLPPVNRKKGNGYESPLIRNRQEIDEQRYLTDAFGEEAEAFIGRHVSENGTQEKPFFLYLAFNAVHTPLQAPQKYLDRFPDIVDKQRRTYAAMLSAMDDAIGRVLRKVSDAQIDSNTLIFFLSDNGGATADLTVNGSRNEPLRGGKFATWEGGIRVPFFARWKGIIPAGSIYDKPVIQMDMSATALAVAGVDVRPEWQLDGVNILPYITEQRNDVPHDVLCWRLGGLMAIRSGDWKLVTPYTSLATIAPQPEGFDPFTGAQLFNITQDIGEKMPVDNPEKVKVLKSKWLEWAKQMPILTLSEAEKRAGWPSCFINKKKQKTQEN